MLSFEDEIMNDNFSNRQSKNKRLLKPLCPFQRIDFNVLLRWNRCLSFFTHQSCRHYRVSLAFSEKVGPSTFRSARLLVNGYVNTPYSRRDLSDLGELQRACVALLLLCSLVRFSCPLHLIVQLIGCATVFFCFVFAFVCFQL